MDRSFTILVPDYVIQGIPWRELIDKTTCPQTSQQGNLNAGETGVVVSAKTTLLSLMQHGTP
jgi:hypothetical protein